MTEPDTSKAWTMDQSLAAMLDLARTSAGMWVEQIKMGVPPKEAVLLVNGIFAMYRPESAK